MCIIAIKPAGHTIPDSIIKTMWDGNSHGAGFMYAENGRVKVVKGFMKLAAFQKALAKHNHRKVVMHFRIKTHGDVSPELTHPFWVHKNGVAMVHNGIIWDYAKKASNTESDSLLYARHFGRRFQRPMEALADATVNAAIAQEIGYSKLVFMDGGGEVAIVNEKLEPGPMVSGTPTAATRTALGVPTRVVTPRWLAMTTGIGVTTPRPTTRRTTPRVPTALDIRLW